MTLKQIFLFTLIMMSWSVISYAQVESPYGRWTNDTVTIELTQEGTYRLFLEDQELTAEDKDADDALNCRITPHPAGWCATLYLAGVEEAVGHIFICKHVDGSLEFIHLNSESPILKGAMPKGTLSKGIRLSPESAPLSTRGD